MVVVVHQEMSHLKYIQIIKYSLDKTAIIYLKFTKATKLVIEKEFGSLTNTILIESLKITKFASLSRAVAGIRQKTLIINLPGSKKGSEVKNYKVLWILEALETSK